MRANKASFERQMRVSKILNKRLSGLSLAEIGQQESPPCSAQNVAQLIQKALGDIPKQPVEQIRAPEASRLDAMQNALWPACLLGDIAAIDRVLAIMKRRAAMLGLDIQPAGYFSRDADDGADQMIWVEIVGDPEPQRLRWLERERERLLGLIPVEGSPTIN